MRKSLSMLVTMFALVGAVAFAPGGASADHCADPDLFLFTSVGGLFDLAQNNTVCDVAPGDEIYDTRLIKPGSLTVSGRLFRTCAANSTLAGTMSGIAETPVTFECSSTTAGETGAFMDTETVEIDPMAPGTITLTVDVPDPSGDVTRTTCYHTIDASCPDMP